MIQPSLKRPKGRMALNYFTPSKNQRDTASTKVVEPRLNGAAGNSPEILSTFGSGMTITGNIVCAGALQVFGRVIGERECGNGAERDEKSRKKKPAAFSHVPHIFYCETLGRNLHADRCELKTEKLFQVSAPQARWIRLHASSSDLVEAA